jgi:hypothetical protein
MINPNDNAYPRINSVSKVDGDMVYSHFPSFTKEEIVLKDFMCALISTFDSRTIMYETDHTEIISKEASLLTTAYFNQLNKQK